MDPYEELGVARDASEKEIRRAYRNKAKTAHPDQGGDREGWERTARALAVLTDPKTRKTFDETGQIDEPKIDNDRACALEIIYSMLGGIINEYVSKNFSPFADARSRDIPEEIRSAIRKEIDQHHRNIETGKKVVEYQRDVKKRFRFKGVGPDAIAASFDIQIAQNEKVLRDLEEGIRLRGLALELLGDYSFEKTVDLWEQFDGPYERAV